MGIQFSVLSPEGTIPFKDGYRRNYDCAIYQRHSSILVETACRVEKVHSPDRGYLEGCRHCGWWWEKWITCTCGVV